VLSLIAEGLSNQASAGDSFSADSAISKYTTSLFANSASPIRQQQPPPARRPHLSEQALTSVEWCGGFHWPAARRTTQVLLRRLPAENAGEAALDAGALMMLAGSGWAT